MVLLLHFMFNHVFRPKLLILKKLKFYLTLRAMCSEESDKYIIPCRNDSSSDVVVETGEAQTKTLLEQQITKRKTTPDFQDIVLTN